MPSWPSASTGLAVFAEKKTKTNRNEKKGRDNDDFIARVFRVISMSRAERRKKKNRNRLGQFFVTLN